MLICTPTCSGRRPAGVPRHRWCAGMAVISCSSLRCVTKPPRADPSCAGGPGQPAGAQLLNETDRRGRVIKAWTTGGAGRRCGRRVPAPIGQAGGQDGPGMKSRRPPVINHRTAARGRPLLATLQWRRCCPAASGAPDPAARGVPGGNGWRTPSCSMRSPRGPRMRRWAILPGRYIFVNGEAARLIGKPWRRSSAGTTACCLRPTRRSADGVRIWP